MTHTYAILVVSKATYDEIATKLRAANYGDAFQYSDGRQVIDMNGIAIAVEVVPVGTNLREKKNKWKFKKRKGPIHTLTL